MGRHVTCIAGALLRHNRLRSTILRAASVAFMTIRVPKLAESLPCETCFSVISRVRLSPLPDMADFVSISINPSFVATMCGYGCSAVKSLLLETAASSVDKSNRPLLVLPDKSHQRGTMEHNDPLVGSPIYGYFSSAARLSDSLMSTLTELIAPHHRLAVSVLFPIKSIGGNDNTEDVVTSASNADIPFERIAVHGTREGLSLTATAAPYARSLLTAGLTSLDVSGNRLEDAGLDEIVATWSPWLRELSAAGIHSLSYANWAGAVLRWAVDLSSSLTSR